MAESLAHENLAGRLDRLMRVAGYNPRSLSVKAGLGATAVRDILDGRVASPRYQTLQALARVLGVGVDQIADGAPTSSLAGPASSEATRDQNAQQDLPVFGAAQGGSDGTMLVSSDAIERVPEPLKTVRGGYGVYVVGESMSPAYEQGDIALVHPTLPPKRESDVILVRTESDGTRHVLIKRLVGWTEESWRLRQHNPAMEFELKRAEWREVQTIVGKYNAR